MKASRLLSLPPYLFEELERRYDAAASEGRHVIDLSIGDPDLAPPPSLKSNLVSALEHPDVDRYPPQRGSRRLKAAIRDYLRRRCGVAPNDDELLILVGSKEGLAHFPWAVCNPGDVVLVPDPGYPVYRSSAMFAGCRVVRLGLKASLGYLPDFESIARDELERTRLCCINYPNNPTGATADEKFLRTTLRFAAENGFILVNDAAYSDVYFDGRPPPLLTGQPGALEQPVVEFFSFSKTYCVTGWRIGFAVGRSDLIEALAHLKANIDSGVFGAIQDAVAMTLGSDGDAFAEEMRVEFQRRRDLTLETLQKLGFECFSPCATFYLWVKVPPPWDSMDFALHLLEEADVLVTPGVGFGKGGEGYFRMALTRPIEEIREAGNRLNRMGGFFGGGTGRP